MQRSGQLIRAQVLDRANVTYAGCKTLRKDAAQGRADQSRRSPQVKQPRDSRHGVRRADAGQDQPPLLCRSACYGRGGQVGDVLQQDGVGRLTKSGFQRVHPGRVECVSRLNLTDALQPGIYGVLNTNGVQTLSRDTIEQRAQRCRFARAT
jgi:hypothetical protein